MSGVGRVQGSHEREHTQNILVHTSHSRISSPTRQACACTQDTHPSADGPSAGSAPLGLQAGGWTELGPETGTVLTPSTPPQACLSLPCNLLCSQG